MTAALVCVGVFAVSLLISWRLAQFIKAMDAADADACVVEEAQRIVDEAGRR